jgi:hypothetical protein
MIEDWPGLTNEQARELAREYCVAIAKADGLEELPSDAWLDVRLRELGCPEDQLEIWRAKIRAMPLSLVADRRANENALATDFSNQTSNCSAMV